MIVKAESCKQIYAQIKDIVILFGVKRTTVNKLFTEMQQSREYVPGVDYIQVSRRMTLIRIEAFQRCMSGKHMKWLKEVI